MNMYDGSDGHGQTRTRLRVDSGQTRGRLGADSGQTRGRLGADSVALLPNYSVVGSELVCVCVCAVSVLCVFVIHVLHL